MKLMHLAPGNQHVVPSSKEPVKARLATPAERRQDSWSKIPESVGTAWCALTHGHAKDHALGRLDDMCRTLGVATIAGLGSLGVSQVGGSLPLILGALSWLGAMAITPKVINGMVWLKTGVNLGTKYQSSNGEIRPLFQDPNYLPLQVLPLDKRIQLVDRLGIQKPHSDRAGLLQNKLKQIAIQAHTWWMLMAGMATPVLAATICDNLETPLKNLASKLWITGIEKTAVNAALKNQQPAQLTKAVEKMANAVLGAGTDMTTSARWWNQLPASVLKALKLDTLPQAVLRNPSAEARLEAVVSHLAHNLGDLKVQDALQTVLHNQTGALNEALAPVENLLKNNLVKSRTNQSVLAKITQQAQLARETAEATMNHLGQLAKLPLDKMKIGERISHIRQAVKNCVLPNVEQLNRTGYVSRGRQMAGGQSFFSKVIGSITSGRFASAQSQMGESSKNFFDRTLRSLGMRRQWLKWFPGVIGVGMLVATAYFVTHILGEDFQQPVRKTGGARK